MYQKYFFISIIFFLTLTIVSVIIAIEQGQNLEKLTKKTKETKMIYTIKTVIEKHYIGGDIYNTSLILNSDDGKHDVQMPIAVNKKDYAELTDNINGIKSRLELLGNAVKLDVVVWEDPNFESKEEADEYLMNH